MTTGCRRARTLKITDAGSRANAICGVSNVKLWRPTKGSRFGYGEKNLFPLLESWNGGDFLLQGNIYSGAIYCTGKVADLARARKWTGIGIKVMSWGCPGGGRAGLRFPDWYEDLRDKLLEAFPIINGEVHSPLDELRKRQQEGIAWPYLPPLEREVPRG